MRLIRCGALVLIGFAVALAATQAPAAVLLSENFDSWTADNGNLYYGMYGAGNPPPVWAWFGEVNPTVDYNGWLGMWKRIEVLAPGDSYPKELQSWWSSQNLGARANPATANGTPSTGKFLCADSDFGGANAYADTGESYDIWTPTFSTAGVSNPWFHCDMTAVQNNNYGFTNFCIDATTDAGATWTTLWERRSAGRLGDDGLGYDPAATTFLPTHDNCGGYYGQLDVDLSAVANQANVMLRIRQYEPSDDWWIAVDNVVVDDVAPLMAGPTVLFQETFDSGLGAMSVSGTQVAGWGQTVSSTIYTDGQMPLCDNVNRLGHNGNGVDFAIVVKDTRTVAGNEWLMTPVLDLSTVSDAILGYDDECCLDKYSGTAKVYLMEDTDGDGVAESTDTILAVLFDYAAAKTNEDAYYAHREIALAGAAGRDDVFVAWVYAAPLSGDYDENWWAIDNVAITTNVPEPSTLALLLGGLLMGWIGWRRR